MRFLVIFLLLAIRLLGFDVTAVTENEPSSLVEGVSVITGDFCLHKPVYLVQGAEPIRLGNVYVSEGWSFTGYEHYRATWYEGRIFIREPYGTEIFYYPIQQIGYIGEFFYGDPKKKKKWKPYTFTTDRFVNEALGIANTASGDISARTHIKNHQIIFNPERNSEGKSFSLHAADGTVRHYVKAIQQTKTEIPYSGIFKNETYYSRYNYLLFQEDLPNGHVLRYIHQGDELVEIRSTNRSGNKIFASVKIPSASSSLVYVGSDGQSANLHTEYVKEAKKNLVKKISSPHGPDLFFNWTAKQVARGKKLHQLGVLSSFSLPEQRKVDIHYDMGDQYTNPKVFSLKAPVGKDSDLLTTHRFVYRKNSTDVFDIEENKTTYDWNDQGRLISIKYFQAGETLYSEERFLWNHTLLVSRSFWDADGVCRFARCFEYDGHGNVAQSYVCGDITGNGGKIFLKSDGSIDLTQTEACLTKSSYTQDERHLPLRVEEASGLITLFTYVPGTNLIKTKVLCDKDVEKITYTYDYDEDFLLIKETVDDGVCQKIKRIFPRQTQPFLGMPEIIEEKYLDGVQEKLLKRKVLYYRAAAQIDHEEIYDAEGNFCYKLFYEYDEKNRIIRQTNPLGQASLAEYDALGNRSLYQDFGSLIKEISEYDFSNRLVRKTLKDPEKERVFEYSYDKKHRLEWEKDERGHKTYYKHDFLGRCIEIIEPPLVKDQGQLVCSTTKKSYNIFGHEVLQIDPEGFETRTTPNIYGKPLQIIHPDGTEEYYTYTLKGELESHITASGVKTIYERDYLGRVIGKKIFEKDSLLSEESFFYIGYLLMRQIDPEGHAKTYDYDPAGRKIAETFGGETIHYKYDSLGRVSEIEEGGEITFKIYDFLDRMIEERRETLSGQIIEKVLYGYNEQGDRTEVTRFIQGKTAKEISLYDSLHRLIQKIDPLSNVETISYEDVFDERSEKVLQKVHVDALGLRTIETFDPQGNLQSVEKQKDRTLSLVRKFYTPSKKLSYQIDTIFASNGLERQVTTRWEYDPMGREIALIEASGTPQEKVTRRTYIPTGEVKTITKPDQTVISYAYNGLSQLIGINASDGSVHHEMSYNRLGHLQRTDQIQRLTDPKGRVLSETFPLGYSIQSDFDDYGRKASFKIPCSGLFIFYNYLGSLLQKISRFNNLEELYSHEYLERDLSKKILKERLIDGSIRTQTFDLLSRKVATASPSFSQEFNAFDPVGNLVSMTRQGEMRTYFYDDLYQLIQETGRFAHIYFYDSLQNRLAKDSECYEVNPLHQVTSHFVYSPNGCPIQGKDIRFVYDALDRLLKVIAPGYSICFVYDSLHRCISKTTYQNGRETLEYFLYDGQKEIGTLDANLQLKELRILGETYRAELSASVALELRGKVFVPLHDLQNNLAALVPLDGSSCTWLDYSAFGEEVIEGPTISPWSFSSKRRDRESGLVYYGRRFYLPELGRWLTPDPSGFTDGMNLYAFVKNEPLMHFDEYGLWLEPSPSGSFDSSRIMRGWRNDATAAWNNPRFQGSLQVTGGFAEMYAGSMLAYTPFYPLGAALFFHGADQFTAGGRSLISGRSIPTATELILQKTGISPGWASIGNNLASTLGVGSALGLARSFSYQVSRSTAQVAMSAFGNKSALQANMESFNLSSNLNPSIELSRFDRAAYNLSEIGQNNIRILRGWAKSKGWEKHLNSHGGPEKWGIYQNSEFQWRLTIKPEASTRPGLHSGSNVPRFDARILSDRMGQSYINPFTGEIGNWQIGTHLPLEINH